MSKKVNSETNPEHKEWTLEQEELLAEWSEKAACYRWLHNQSEKYYRVRNYAFTIPVINCFACFLLFSISFSNCLMSVSLYSQYSTISFWCSSEGI